MKMLRYLAGFLALAAVILAISGCNGTEITIVKGSGNVQTESRSVSGFTQVSLSLIGSMTIEQSGEESLVIEAEDNFLPKIKTEVSGGRLNITAVSGTNFLPNKAIRYMLKVKTLDAIELNGAADIVVSNLSTDNLQVTVNGAGSITISGNVARQQINLSGAGNYEAANLASKEARVTLTGLGSATLRVSDKLDVTISGAGSVNYIGDPAITKNITGVGSLNKR
jgi:hypothetical protein